MDVIDGVYRKRVDPASGKTLPEDNWVWSPQGAIDMHMPERWGVVQFSEAVAGTRPVSIVEDRNDLVTWALRRLYYRQRSYRATHGQYASDLEALRAGDIRMEGVSFKPSLTCHRAAMKSARRGSMAASCTLPRTGACGSRAARGRVAHEAKRTTPVAAIVLIYYAIQFVAKLDREPGGVEFGKFAGLVDRGGRTLTDENAVTHHAPGSALLNHANHRRSLLTLWCRRERVPSTARRFRRPVAPRHVLCAWANRVLVRPDS
jgi:hypothetical protein